MDLSTWPPLVPFPTPDLASFYGPHVLQLRHLRLTSLACDEGLSALTGLTSLALTPGSDTYIAVERLPRLQVRARSGLGQYTAAVPADGRLRLLVMPHQLLLEITVARPPPFLPCPARQANPQALRSMHVALPP